MLNKKIGATITGLFVVVLLLSFVLIQAISLEEGAIKNSIDGEAMKNLDVLVKGNGAVTNIWIDSYERISRLGANDLRYLFVDVGKFSADGKLLTTDEELMSFLNLVMEYEEKNDYGFVLIPYNDINTNFYDFTQEEFNRNFIESHRRLINLGFDGIYLDIEPVKFEHRDAYLKMIERFRSEFSDEFLGVYAGHFGSDEKNYWVWDKTFYEEVSKRVDFIFAGLYDSGAQDKAEYEEYVRRQFDEILSSNLNSLVMFGVPTHRKYETAESALEIYHQKQLEDNSRVIGFVVFAEWTTNGEEWDVIESYVKKSP